MQPKSRRPALLFSRNLLGPLIVTLAAAGLTGCPPDVTNSTKIDVKRFPGVKVTVACPTEELAQLMATYSQRWTSRTGAEAKVVRQGPTEDADVWVVRAPELPTHAAAGSLRPLPEKILTGDAFQWKLGLLPVYKDKLLVWDGTAYAVPLLGEAPLCFYRKDLVAPPATWEEFLAAAGKGPGKPLPPLPRGDAELCREFFCIAAPFARRLLHESDQSPKDNELFSFHFDLETMKPRVAEPAFVHALKLMQQMQKLRPAGDADQPAEAFERGEAALCLADARWIDRFKISKVAGKWGFCRVPGAGLVFPYGPGEAQTVSDPNFVPYLGAVSWVAAVAKGSLQPDAAFDLLEELTGPKTSGQIVIEPRWGGGAVRRDQLANNSGWTSFGLEQGETRDLVKVLEQTLSHPAVKNPVVALRVPGQEAYEKALLEQVRLALTKDKDASQALAAAAEAWRELVDKEGLKKARRNYYLSLSLQPPG